MLDRIACDVCGEFTTESGANAQALSECSPDERARFSISHYIRQQSLYRDWPVLTEERIKAVMETPAVGVKIVAAFYLAPRLEGLPPA